MKHVTSNVYKYIHYLYFILQIFELYLNINYNGCSFYYCVKVIIRLKINIKQKLITEFSYNDHILLLVQNIFYGKIFSQIQSVRNNNKAIV